MPVNPSQTLLQLAQQGNPRAIAQLVNHALHAQGIRASTQLREDCLQILLEADSPPAPERIVPYLHRGLLQLGAVSIRTVRIYGRQSGQPAPAWSRGFQLLPAPAPLLEPQQQTTAQSAIAPPALMAPGLPKPLAQPTESGVPVQVSPMLTSLLLAFLWTQIGLDMLLFLYFSLKILFLNFYPNPLLSDFPPLFASTFKTSLVTVHHFWRSLGILPRLLNGFALGLMLLWLYRLHTRLRQAFPGYAITPWGAIARYLIPLYSLLGVWQVFTTLADHLPRLGEQSPIGGRELRRWLPWFYAGWLVSGALEWMYRIQASHADLSPGFFWAFNGAALFSRITWLQLVQIPVRAIARQPRP